jgi:tetratricopeptide (TPR) repeat protein
MVFESLFGKSKTPVPPVREDVTLGDRTAKMARTRLQSGNWKEALEVLDKAPRDWNIRDLAVRACSEWKGRPAWLDPWRVAMETHPLPWLLCGMHSIKWAWEARSSSVASEVDDDAWPLFLERLEMARVELLQAAALAPDDPRPWAHMITAYVGLDRNIGERMQPFNEAIARDPDSFFAHSGMLMALCEKWGGTHDQMFDFVRTSAAKAPAGSATPIFIAEAHAERWLYFSFDDDGEGQQEYFREEAVRDDIKQVRELCAGVTSPPFARHCANTLAWCFFMMGDRKSARVEFEKAGGCFWGGPWRYYPDAVKSYDGAMRASW